MEVKTDLEALLNSTKNIAEKRKKIVDEQLDSLLKDKNTSQEDKDYASMINSKINQAVNNKDSEAMHSIINELTNKIKK
jgi:hypothetical protein